MGCIMRQENRGRFVGLNRLLKIVFLILVALTPLLAGCVKQDAPTDTTPTATSDSPLQTAWPTQGVRPNGVLGLTNPVPLNDEDKSLLTLIAQGSWSSVEFVSFGWYAIIWAASVPLTVWLVDEQTAIKGIPDYINPNALWYPGITVTHTEGGVPITYTSGGITVTTMLGAITYGKQVAVDYDSFRTVYNNGPYVMPTTPPPSR
jgi:hypothetical protein